VREVILRPPPATTLCLHAHWHADVRQRAAGPSGAHFMRNLGLSSWHALWPTLFGLLLVSLLGICLLAMQAVQQRHQRENRQI
jgi:hypothetical protein